MVGDERLPKRVRSRGKRARDAANVDFSLVRNHPTSTVYVPPTVQAELDKLKTHEGCSKNTLFLRAVALLLEHYDRPTFVELSGEDPWTW